MKNLVKTLIMMPLAALSLISCNDSSETTYQAYMPAVSSIGTPYSCYFISDDSIKVIPTGNYNVIKNFVTNDRALATFVIPAGKITNPVEVEFSAITKLETESITYSAKPDTCGSDGIDIENAWHCGGVDGTNHFLTIAYSYAISASAPKHEFYLVDNSSSLNNPDEDGYYHLELRHDSNDDTPLMKANTVSTFMLPPQYTQSGYKGLIIDYIPLSQTEDNGKATKTISF